jgi:putative tryptophan/tyrosine transport system substrate-binding protein
MSETAMKRRKFLVGLLAGLITTGARAQRRVRISILHSGFPNRTPIHQLFEALSKLGLEHGRTATIDLLGGEGDPKKLGALVEQIRVQKPDVVIAITSPAVVALKEARLTIPVVFAFVPDPVGLGIVESLAQPGGNFTGVTYSESGLGGKRLEMLLEAVTGTTKVAVFWNPSFPGHADALENTRSSALARGIEVYSRELKGIEDLESAFDDAVRAKAQAAVFMADNVMFGNRKRVAELALRQRLPTIHSFPSEVEDGGLMFYGPSNGENYRRAAALTERILKGKRPAELPVERPTKFELIINLKTAKAFGLTISEAFLLRADQVIE